jgi:hypothetical protein
MVNMNAIYRVITVNEGPVLTTKRPDYCPELFAKGKVHKPPTADDPTLGVEV